MALLRQYLLEVRARERSRAGADPAPWEAGLRLAALVPMAEADQAGPDPAGTSGCFEFSQSNQWDRGLDDHVHTAAA